MTNRNRMLISMAAASVAGAVAGLLLAPAKGSRTRQQIIDAPRMWVNQLGSLLTKKTREVNAELDRVRHQKAAVEDRVNKLKQGLG